MILFTHFSMLILAVSLLLFLGFWEVARSRFRSVTRSWLLWHLGATSLFNLALLLDDSVYSFGPRIFYYLEYPTILAAAITYGELCYSVAGLGGSRHLKIYRYVVSACTILWAFGLYTGISTQADYASFEFARLHMLPVGLFVWPIAIFVYRLRQEGVPVWSPVHFMRKLPELPDEQKAMLGFLLASVLRLVSSATPFLSLIPMIPWELVLGVFATNNLLIVVVMVVTYFEYIERWADLASRIVSMLSVISLMLFIAVVLMFFAENRAIHQVDAALLEQHDVQISPTSSGYRADYRPVNWQDSANLRLAATPTAPAQVELPFEFPFFGQMYKRVLIYPSGQIVPAKEGTKPKKLSVLTNYECIIDQPVIAAFCAPHKAYSVFVSESSKEFVVLWKEESPENSNIGATAFQVRITPRGNFDLSYNGIPTEAPFKRWTAIGVHDGTAWPLRMNRLDEVPFLGTAQGLWMDLAVGQRIAIHVSLWPVALLISGIIFIFIFVVRPYFSRLIVQPLEKVKSGLQRVRGGQLDHVLDEGTKNEFAEISAGFNHMSRALNRFRQQIDEQTTLMEEEITFRTLEAARKIDKTILSKDQVFEEKLRGVINTHIGDANFQVAELAEEMAVSTRQLHRRVVNLTALTPAALIRSLRLEHAHALLSARAANVSEACYQSGFKDVSYFSKLFQKKFGHSPSSIAVDA